MFGRNFHLVSRTDGEIYALAARTDTSVFGGWGPGRCLEESVPAKTGKSKRANKTTPTRHLPVAQCVRHCGFHLGTSSFFSNIFGGASSRCDRTVQQTTSGRFQRRARSRPRFGKKKKKLEYQASRREAVTRFVKGPEVEEELARHVETRSLTWRRAARGTASKNEWSTRLCWCEHGV